MDADFFAEFEQLGRYTDKLKRANTDKKIDYVAIASPSYMQDSHMGSVLRGGSDVIGEKPLVLNPWDIDSLKIVPGIYRAERESGHEYYH